MDELHAFDHIYVHNFALFSVRLNSQRYEILEAQDCTDPTASLDLQWKVSLFYTPHIIIGLSKCGQYTSGHIQASVRFILCQ